MFGSRGAGVPPAKIRRTTKIRRTKRRGQSLIEFAVVALVTYLLLAAIITFGFYFYAAQGSQSTVDVLARELSRSPLPAAGIEQFDVLYSDPATLPADAQESVRQFRRRVFDHHYLVLAQSDVLDAVNGGWNQSFVSQLPLVNQQILPLMINDQIGGTRYFRYPGAVYEDNNPSDNPAAPESVGLLVRIPIVSGRGEFGIETISWLPVVEPILAANALGEPVDPFAINADVLQPGMVALRLNYPAQSSVMSSFRRNEAADDYPFEATIGSPNAADDAAVTDSGGPWLPEGPLVASDFEFGPYSGSYSLGKQAAFGSPNFVGTATGVRPFRRVISAQAVYRREVFES
jgi:hypothetical protein